MIKIIIIKMNKMNKMNKTNKIIFQRKNIFSSNSIYFKNNFIGVFFPMIKKCINGIANNSFIISTIVI